MMCWLTRRSKKEEHSVRFYPPSPQRIIEVMEHKGYVTFDGPQAYNLNLIGIRTKDTSSNKFNDWVCVIYRNDEIWNLFSFPATTDPGVYWRNNPMHINGTAILKPGQYRGSHRIGFHKSYAALQQHGSVVVYRDANRDDVLDFDGNKQKEGVFGINIHRASSVGPSSKVNKWSAGCQVLQDPFQFEFLMDLARASARIFGNSFTYTLLIEEDFA